MVIKNVRAVMILGVCVAAPKKSTKSCCNECRYNSEFSNAQFMLSTSTMNKFPLSGNKNN